MLFAQVIFIIGKGLPGQYRVIECDGKLTCNSIGGFLSFAGLVVKVVAPTTEQPIIVLNQAVCTAGMGTIVNDDDGNEHVIEHDGVPSTLGG